MSAHPETKIDCSKVYVKKSSFSNEQTGDFDGAFAAVPIKAGELAFTLLSSSSVHIYRLQCIIKWNQHYIICEPPK